MALNFPDSPFVGQIYSDVTAGFSYVWDGTVWKSYYQSDQTPDGTVTPPKLSTGGPVWNTSGDLNITGILTAANISVAGTITYNDVTSVDSIGVVTARSGVVVVGGGVSVAGGGIDVNGHTETDTLRVSGIATFQSGFNVNSFTRYGDGIYQYFGNSDDLLVAHISAGTERSVVSSSTNLPLYISSNDLSLRSQTEEIFASFTANGSASLYYDNSKKFETLGTGVTITGQISASAGVLAGFSTFTNIRLANDAGDNTSQYVTAIGQNYVIGYNTGGGYPEDKYFQFSSGNPNFILENVGIGTTNATEKLTVKGDVGVGGTLTIQQTTEVLNTKTGAGNTVTHDFSTGSIWYHSGISTDFTLNLTNVPTTEDRSITVTLFLDQGGTGYYANGLEVDGVTQTIKWANNATPIPSTNKLDVQSFTLIRANTGAGVTWVTLGQLINYN